MRNDRMISKTLPLPGSDEGISRDCNNIDRPGPQRQLWFRPLALLVDQESTTKTLKRIAMLDEPTPTLSPAILVIYGSFP